MAESRPDLCGDEGTNDPTNSTADFPQNDTVHRLQKAFIILRPLERFQDRENRERAYTEYLRLEKKKESDRTGEEEEWEERAVGEILDGPPVLELKIDYGFKRSSQKCRYKMESLPRGRVVIYNVTDINGAERRTGSEFDVANLKNLFLRLGFCVKILLECTALEFSQSLKKECNSEDLKDMDSFVVFIMTHGTSHGILRMKDGEEIALKNVELQLDGKIAPLLAGKPKLIFVQACRGDGIEEDCTSSDTAYDGIEVGYDAKVPLELGPVDASDLFISQSTHSGCKSERHPKKGSRFVRALALVLARHAHHRSYSEVMSQVHRITTRLGGHVQVPQKQDTGRFDLYLSPVEHEPLIREAESNPLTSGSED